MQQLEYHGKVYDVPLHLVEQFKYIDRDIAFLKLKFDRQNSPDETWMYSDEYLHEMETWAIVYGTLRIENLLYGAKNYLGLHEMHLGIAKDPEPDPFDDLDLEDLPEIHEFTDDDLLDLPPIEDGDIPGPGVQQDEISLEDLERFLRESKEDSKQREKQNIIKNIKRHFRLMLDIDKGWMDGRYW